jgi:hypothetical protein
MINEHELNSAFKTKDMAYNLLIWLNSAIKKGIINPVKAMEYTTSFLEAKEWVVEHYLNLYGNRMGLPKRILNLLPN